MVQVTPKGRFGVGFFWGCITPLLVIALLAIAAILYGYYYFQQGFTNDPGIQAVMTALNENRLARDLLGDDISVSGLQSAGRSAFAGHGTVETYMLRVEGSKAAGIVRGRLEGRNEESLDLKSLRLMMPDGHVYDLKTPSQRIPAGSI